MASKKQCERAIDLHEGELSSRQNVVGLGIVPEEGGSDRFAVAVYVTKKLPLSQLAAADVVPESIEVPGRGRACRRIRTRVIEQGEVALEGEPGTGKLRG